MIAYHSGNGNITPLASDTPVAQQVSFNDTIGLAATNVQTAIEKLKTNLESEFQSGVDVLYDACSTRGIPPASHSLNDVKNAILANEGTFNAYDERSEAVDMGVAQSYRYVNTLNVANYNDELYTFPEGSDGVTVDLGETNKVALVNATNVYAAGVDYGASTVIFKFIQVTPQTGASISQNYIIPYEYSGNVYVFYGRNIVGPTMSSSLTPTHSMNVQYTPPDSASTNHYVTDVYKQGQVIIPNAVGGSIIDVIFDLSSLPSSPQTDELLQDNNVHLGVAIVLKHAGQTNTSISQDSNTESNSENDSGSGSSSSGGYSDGLISEDDNNNNSSDGYSDGLISSDTASAPSNDTHSESEDLGPMLVASEGNPLVNDGLAHEEGTSNEEQLNEEEQEESESPEEEPTEDDIDGLPESTDTEGIDEEEPIDENLEEPT